MNTEETKQKKIIKMSVVDRVFAIGYIHTLPCTWQRRIEYETVHKLLSPTEEEKVKAGFTMSKDGQPVAETDFLVDIDVTDFPLGISFAIKRQLDDLQQSRLTEQGDFLHKMYHNWCRVMGPLVGYVEIEDPKRTDIVY